MDAAFSSSISDPKDINANSQAQDGKNRGKILQKGAVEGPHPIQLPLSDRVAVLG
jgi:hypothetical protein